MHKLIISLMVGMGLLIAAPAASADSEKFLVILQAGTEGYEGMARSYHALLYSQELIEEGHEVVLVFDGAGTQWAHEWSKADSESPYKPVYDELTELGITEVVCDYCASGFKVKEALTQKNANLVAEYSGHPSIAKYVKKGYQLLIL